MFKFYTELTFNESLDHCQPNWSPDVMETYRQWYSEDIQGKDTLLVTVGDSWTWGDHLGAIDWDKASDDPCRLQQIFGRKLADKLNADWVNLARPGCSNYWMLEKMQDVVHHFRRLKETYKRICLVITLTEDLREASYTRRINVEEPYRKFWDQSRNIQEFLISVERYLFDNLQEYFNEIPNVECFVSRAFTDSWPVNKRDFLLDKTWCDVIQDHVKYPTYMPVPFIAQMSIDPLRDKYISNNLQKEEFLEIMESVGTRWEFLGHSQYNLKGSTCHPNPEGHELWAEYLFSKVQ